MGTIAIVTSNLIVFEFLAGMLIAYIYKNFNLHHKVGWLLGMFGFILLLSSVNQVVDPRLSRVFYLGVPSTLIVLGENYAKPYRKSLLKYLGDASYSSYLIHTLVISFFFKGSAILSITFNYDVLALLCLLLSTICGALLYSLVERPLTNYIKFKF